jgi:hypothetical protein
VTPVSRRHIKDSRPWPKTQELHETRNFPLRMGKMRSNGRPHHGPERPKKLVIRRQFPRPTSPSKSGAYTAKIQVLNLLKSGSCNR